MTKNGFLSRAIELHKQGNLAEAETLYRQVLDTQPDDADALNAIGVFECQLGRLDSAEALIGRALEIAPESAKAHNNLGNVYRYQGRPAEAETAFRRAAEFDPEDAGARFNLATVLLERGRPEDALLPFREARARAPDDSRFAAGLARCLARIPEADALADRQRALALGDDMAHVLGFEGVDTTPLRRLATVLAMARPGVQRALEDMGRAGPDWRPGGETLGAVMAETLLTRAMARDLLTDPALERVMTAVRRHALETGGAGIEIPFLAALARQCFINEYVWAESDEETERVNALETGLADDPAPGTAAVLVLGCYRALGETAAAERVKTLQGPDLADVIRLQVMEPADERAIAAVLPRLAPIAEGVSRAVKAQYEENPYPRWRHLAAEPPVAFGRAMARRFPFLGRDKNAWAAKPEILVAGAGTGREPIMYARDYENASVLAVDLSRASLAYGKRMAGKLGVANIEFAEADILALASLGRVFDVIVASGVLHHMADPVAGWRTLAGLLAEGGVMVVGLYSERAREAVVAARALIREHGFEATPAGIRACRARIMDLAPGHPAAPVMATADFYTLSGCRDLIFHVEEHRFTIAGIKDALDTLGLRFLGFEAPPMLLARYRERFPGDAEMTDLADWQALEAEDGAAFWNMYQFWCAKT